MNYDIKEVPKRLFFGVTNKVDLNKPESLQFHKFWNDTFEIVEHSKISNEYSSIGLELYPDNFNETKQFTYTAAVPYNTKDGVPSKYIKEIGAGKFIRFEGTYEQLTAGYIPKVYEYIRENNIPIEWGFDYEEYPPDFDHQNPKSKIYVCFRYKG